MVGVIGHDGAETNVGAVRVHSGVNGELLDLCEGDTTYEALGSSVAAADLCGTIAGFGTSCVGLGGFAPLLEATGGPISHQSIQIDLTNSLGGEAMILLLAVKKVEEIVPACSLLVSPLPASITMPVFGPAMAGQGFAKVEGTVPTIAEPLELHLQAAGSDPSAPAGFVLTNGVEMTLLP